jgi:adenosylhomocysteine nucleosidase
MPPGVADSRTVIPTGIVVAMLPEAAALTGAPPRAGATIELLPGVTLHVGGIGPERAARAAELLVAAGARALVSFGVAGALVRGLAPGDLLVPARVETDSGALRIHGRWRARAIERFSAASVPVAEGSLAESGEILASIERKSALAARSNAVAVDMESASVLRVAHRHGLPTLVLRVVSDAAHMEIPASVLRRTDPWGAADLGGLVLDLLRSPAQLPALMRLGRASMTAGRSLRRIGQLVPAMLPDHDLLDVPR